MNFRILEFILILLGIATSISAVCDNVFYLDAQKRQLNQHFENWWNKVKFYNKHKLALLFAKKVSIALDSTFGEKIISKRLIFKCSAISTGLLLITLSILNITKQEAIGVAPWKTYQEGINQIMTVTESLASPTNFATFPILNLELARDLNNSTNKALLKAGSDYFLVTKDTNGMFERTDFGDIRNGGVTVYFRKFYKMDSTNTTMLHTNMASVINATIEQLNTLHNMAKTYTSKKYVILYSIAFYVVMFILNAFLFCLSMVFCKVAISEMSKSGGLISILSLFFTNAFFVIVISSVLMVILTFIAIPLFWVAYPLLKYAAADSAFMVVSFLLLSGFVLLVSIGTTTKLVIFTSLIPSLFAGIVGLFSILTIKYRNAFYYITKFVLIRLSEKSPFAFLGGIILIISMLITILNEVITFTIKH